MHRWGCTENHTYPIGAFSSLKKAKEAGKQEEQYRGGKYVCSIYKSILDSKKKRYIPVRKECSVDNNALLYVSKTNPKDIVLVKEMKCRTIYDGNTKYVCFRKLSGNLDTFVYSEKAFFLCIRK